MEKILTISVAAYNVEKFLEQTLGSLTDPRYVDKLEVFVVDDGGKDASLEIARNYERRYPGTFHAVHKDNGGYGSTVNYSIPRATGKYFKILDGDDWMDRDGLAAILGVLEECGDDVVATKHFSGPGEGEMKVVPARKMDGFTIRVRDYDTAWPHGMWDLFYRTRMLQASGVKLMEHTLYTDQIYSTVPFATAETLRFVDIPVYCYRVGREEQSTSIPARRKHAEEMLRVCDWLYDFYEEHKEGNRYLLARVSRYYVVAIKTLMILPINGENHRRLIAYERDAKQKHPDLYAQAAAAGKVGKLIRVLRGTGYAPYWLLWLIPKKRA